MTAVMADEMFGSIVGSMSGTGGSPLAAFLYGTPIGQAASPTSENSKKPAAPDSYAAAPNPRRKPSRSTPFDDETPATVKRAAITGY